MDRSYRLSIQALRDIKREEIADDIEDYVNYLAHERFVFLNELRAADTFRAKEFLKQNGYLCRKCGG